MLQVVNQWTEAKRLRTEWIVRYKNARHPRGGAVEALENLGDNPSPEAVGAIRKRYGALPIPTHWRCGACREMCPAVVNAGSDEGEGSAFLCAKCVLKAFKMLEEA